MSYLDQKIAIETLFETEWDDETLVIYENVEFSGGVEEWVRLSIKNSDAFQASLGKDNHSYRYVGVVFVQIFTKPNIGARRAMELADKVSSIFKSKTVSGITFKVPLAKPVVSFQEWYQINVTVEFFRGE